MEMEITIYYKMPSTRPMSNMLNKIPIIWIEVDSEASAKSVFSK